MKIQLKRSNVLVENNARQPTAGQMEYGELAVNYNTTDPAIFIKDSNNNIVRIAGKYNIADDGQVELPATPTPPSDPKAGNLWYNNTDGRLYIYYTDADSSQWVDASPDSWDPASYPDVSDDTAQSGTLDDRYLMLNSANDPITNGLNISTGNVGIGTTSPDEKLDVTGGNVIIQSGTGSNNINLKTSVGNANDSHFRFLKSRGGNGAIADVVNNDDTGTISWGGYYDGAFQETSTIRSQASISDGSYSDRLIYDSDEHLIRTANATRIAVINNGNVGIGTNDPESHLEVVASNPMIRARSNANNTSIVALDGTRAANTIGGQVQGQWGGNVVSAIRFINGDDDVNRDNGEIGLYTAPQNSSLIERIRIDADGKVGIGTNDPVSALQVSGNVSANNYTIGDPSVDTNAGTIGNSATGGYIQLWGTNTALDGAVIVGTAEGSANEVARFCEHGLNFKRNNTETDCLDDYEQGTFTPTLNSTGTAPSVVYGTQAGYYTKIGNVVYFTFTLTVTTVNSVGTGNLQVRGFPVNAVNQNNQRAAGFVGYAVNWATAQGAPASWLFANNTNALTFYRRNADSTYVGSTSGYPVAGLINSANIRCSGFYYSA